MSTFTVCFCGTECWEDEGEADHFSETRSKPAFYGPAGYIPVRIYGEIDAPSMKAVVPGPGKPYASAGVSLMTRYEELNWSLADTAFGSSMSTLADHGAASVVGIPSTGRGPSNLSLASNEQVMAQLSDVFDRVGANLFPNNPALPPSGTRLQFHPNQLPSLLDYIQPARENQRIRTINLIGHSRGAVAALICSHQLACLFPDARINIFAIDPVRGPGSLTREMMQLAPTVKNYVGVYALDEVTLGFNGVVPWPLVNAVPYDPLAVRETTTAAENRPNYHLIYTPGRHGTVAGNRTQDGAENLDANTDRAAAVGLLVDRLARACLRAWGTRVPDQPTGVSAMGVSVLKTDITASAALAVYRQMRQSTYLPQGGALRERGIVYTEGVHLAAEAFLEDIIGEELLVERNVLLNPRRKPGKIAWQRIQDIPTSVFSTGFWANDDQT